MQRDVCHKTVAREAAKRIHDEEYKELPWHDGNFQNWSKEFSLATPNHFADGVTIWVSDEPMKSLGSVES